MLQRTHVPCCNPEYTRVLPHGGAPLPRNGGAWQESREEEEKRKPGLRADEQSCRRPKRGAKFGLRISKVTKEREKSK